MIETALRTALLADVTISALVDARRIYPVMLPQAPVYPALTFQTISGDSHYAMQGPSELANPRIQIDCYAESYDVVMDLRNAVIACLGGYQGTSAGVVIHGVFKVMETDGFENELTQSGLNVWRKTLDFNIWFKEAFE